MAGSKVGGRAGIDDYRSGVQLFFELFQIEPLRFRQFIEYVAIDFIQLLHHRKVGRRFGLAV